MVLHDCIVSKVYTNFLSRYVYVAFRGDILLKCLFYFITSPSTPPIKADSFIVLS